MKPVRRRGQRGFGLIDGLIAMAILAFGLLGMTRLQTRTLAQATEANFRMTAVQFGDELISSALVDAVNHDCYTLPASGSCASTVARAATTDWSTRLGQALPAGAATSTYTAADGRLTVVISWSGKDSGDLHTLRATTDVRQ